ncbi:Helicase MOV-10 [Chytriomyces hyalinus]|nr:Helicase MOV-10 [Chytriomyces hyalinus]
MNVGGHAAQWRQGFTRELCTFIDNLFSWTGNDAAYTMLAYHKLLALQTKKTRGNGSSPVVVSQEEQTTSSAIPKRTRNRRKRDGQNKTNTVSTDSMEPNTANSKPAFGATGLRDSMIPFLEAFRETLAATSVSIRSTELNSVLKLKECFKKYRAYVRMMRTTGQAQELEEGFQSLYRVAPLFPKSSFTDLGVTPASSVYFLTSQQFLQKFGRPRTQITFVHPANDQDAGKADTCENRINIPHIQVVLSKCAPLSSEIGSEGIFPVNCLYTAEFEIYNGYSNGCILMEVITGESDAMSQLSFEWGEEGFDNSVAVPGMVTSLESSFKSLSLATKKYVMPRVHLPPKTSVPFFVRLNAKHTGFFARRVIFLFNTIRVERIVRFRVIDDSMDMDLYMAPTVPYLPKQRNSFVEDASTVLRGEKPPSPKFESFKYDLPAYEVSLEMKALHQVIKKSSQRFDPKKLSKMPSLIKQFVVTPLAANFAQRFHDLIHLEEMQMSEDIRDYDKAGEELTISGNYLMLKVPGLAENRPSVLYGDKIIVKLDNGGRFEGYVHKVELASVLLKFAKKFHQQLHIPGMKVNVQFSFSRTCFRRAHRSISLIGFAGDMATCWTFPTGIPPALAEVSSREAYKKRYGKILKEQNLNEVQVKAVLQIASKTESHTPFVIFGPPGTGKTRTLVEAVKVVISSQPTARILISAPSNAAVDLIVHRLSDANAGGFPPSELLRVNAYTRARHSVPDYIERYSKYDESSGLYTIPTSQAALKSYKIVCTTLYTASSLYGMGAFDEVVGEQGQASCFFSHIFVDEAGHATETEFWAGIGGAFLPMLHQLQESDIPSNTLAEFNKITGPFRKRTSSKGNNSLLPQLVVVGDPKQLGPIIRSKLAEACEYDMSYLERLIETCDAYRQHKNPSSSDDRYENPHAIVRLRNNYRSHPAILELYSMTFYDGDLVQNAPLDDRISKLSWLPNRSDFPIIFHGVCGKDDREGTSPSWFNLDEVAIVIKYVRTLLTGTPPPFTLSTKRKDGASKSSKTSGGLFGDAILHMEKSSSGGITVGSIGIITPYRKQIDKIRLQLKKNGWEKIKVGSVEEFQGDEKKIIILSTVRSSAQWIEKDFKFNIGFLKNPKRFNVSISRAKALMITVGNPEILCGDEHWDRLVRYCEDNNACVGYPPPAKTSARTFNQKTEDDSDDDGESDRDVQGIAWRHDE